MPQGGGRAVRYADWKISKYRPGQLQALGMQGIPPLVAAILSARGLGTVEAARAYLSDNICPACDPMAMADMPAAAARVRRALAQGETVAVYGDYDVDGITSCCLLTEYLRDKGLRVLPYIPDRMEEGYGLNCAAVRRLAAQGASLIITVDCGVTAVEEAAFARSLGVDLVITDHHECAGPLPAACAVVDPRRPDCPYPHKDLAGVGVAFKLACAVEGFDQAEALLARLGDLVAIGTVADVMPVTGENRVLIRRGLGAIRSGVHCGVSALLRETGICRAKPNCGDIGFSLAPRLNAAGRMKNASLALELLLCREEERAQALSRQLCDLNAQRRQTEKAIFDEALAMLGPGWPYGMPIVLDSDHWHQGVAGIVASRLTERFRAPVILICMDGDKGRGSCRSFGSFNVYEALCACADTLESFGGHALAAGVNVRREQLGDFRGAFCSYFAQHRPAAQAPDLQVDFNVDNPAFLDLENVDALSMLEPCGPGNPSPVLCMTDLRLSAVTPLGDGSHTRLRFTKYGQDFDCICFFRTAEALRVRRGSRVDIAFCPQINEFRGRRSVQLVLTELRPCLDRRRSLERDLDLCLRQRPGCSLSPQELEALVPLREELAALVPSRADFAALWRALTGETVSMSGPFRDVLEDMAFIVGGSVATQYICLRVLDELGLIRLRETGDTLEIHLVPGHSKVDLNASEILKGFARQAGKDFP